jgi:hypothetical protein
MSRSLRLAATLLLIGSFGMLVQGPLCAEERCPMDRATAAELCATIGADCCQTEGNVPCSPVQAPGPAPLAEALVVSAADTDLLVHALTDPPAAPAVVQGVGLFTLFAVFLI